MDYNLFDYTDATLLQNVLCNRMVARAQTVAPGAGFPLDIFYVVVIIFIMCVEISFASSNTGSDSNVPGDSSGSAAVLDDNYVKKQWHGHVWIVLINISLSTYIS